MLKIGIITASVREGRLGNQVTDWVLDFANARKDEGVTYESVDLKDYRLPLLGVTPTEEEGATIQKWSEKIASFDGYVIVVPEYNRAIPGAFKNAWDYLQPQLHNKAIAFVGYGGLGATRSIDQLRLAAGEQHLASVRTTVNFLLAVDFENFSTFKPGPFHANNANPMLDQLILWSNALKAIR